MQEIISFLENHWLLSLSFIIVFVLIIFLELIKQKKGAARLTPQQAILLMNHENAVVVDIRNPDSFMSGHIIGAVSLPLADIENKSNKLEKYKSQTIILACASGFDSDRAAASLTKKGFKTLVLAGGLTAWRNADMPLTKEK